MNAYDFLLPPYKYQPVPLFRKTQLEDRGQGSPVDVVHRCQYLRTVKGSHVENEWERENGELSSKQIFKKQAIYTLSPPFKL